MSNVSLAIVQDERRALDNGRYPVRLRVTFKLKDGLRSRWVQKYYGDNLSLSIKDFATYSAPRSEEVRTVKRELSVFENKARRIVENNETLTPELFETLFYGIALDTVNGMFTKTIDELRARDQVGTARVYNTDLLYVRVTIVCILYPCPRLVDCELCLKRFEYLGRKNSITSGTIK